MTRLRRVVAVNVPHHLTQRGEDHHRRGNILDSDPVYFLEQLVWENGQGVSLSAESEKLFRRLLKDLRPLFKESGFHASSQNFILESDECWVIVNFQKSRWGERDETTFYVNVAACSKRWLGIHGKPAEKVPHYFSCDWQWRVEHFGPDQHIQQWTLSDENSLQVTLAYLQNLFRDFVLPAATTMTMEAELLKRSGGFEWPQLKTRAVILAATNQIGALRQTVSTLIEKFGSGTAGQKTGEHLEMLRSKYPEAMRTVEIPTKSHYP